MQSNPIDVHELITIMNRDPANRRVAFNALMALKTDDCTQALLHLIETFRVPPYYVDILHEVGQRGALDTMQQFRRILEGDADMNVHASNQLEVIGKLVEYPDHPDTIPLLRYTLRHQSSKYMLQNCVYSLGKIGNIEAVYTLSQLLHAPLKPKVKHDAVIALGFSRHPQAVEVLLNYLAQDLPLTEKGYLTTNCVNAINGLLRLWNAGVRPFDKDRWLNLIEYWLYADNNPYPNTLFILKNLDLPEAKALIEKWEGNQPAEGETRLFY